MFAYLESDLRIAMGSEPLSKESAIHALSGIRHLLAIIPLETKAEQLAADKAGVAKTARLPEREEVGD